MKPPNNNEKQIQKNHNNNKIDNNNKKTDWLLCGLLTPHCKKKNTIQKNIKDIKNIERDPPQHQKNKRSNTQNKKVNKNNHKPSTSEKDKKREAREKEKESTRNKMSDKYTTPSPTLQKSQHNIYAPRQKIIKR